MHMATHRLVRLSWYRIQCLRLQCTPLKEATSYRSSEQSRVGLRERVDGMIGLFTGLLVGSEPGNGNGTSVDRSIDGGDVEIEGIDQILHFLPCLRRVRRCGDVSHEMSGGSPQYII